MRYLHQVGQDAVLGVKHRCPDTPGDNGRKCERNQNGRAYQAAAWKYLIHQHIDGKAHESLQCHAGHAEDER